MSRKYTYWLDEKEFNSVRETLEAEDIRLKEAKKMVCIPLSSKIKFGFVAPGAWSASELCRRQLTWYGASRFAGQTLLISQQPLWDFGIEILPETIIEKIQFKPETKPEKNREKFSRLLDNEAFRMQCPEEYMDIGNMGEGQQERWLKIMGIRGISYADLFGLQCANHANFIEPEFYLEKDNQIIPYSIGKTNKACSACLQFFNIIGRRYTDKYVVPCPGASLYAGLAVNKYYHVRSGDSCPAD